MKLWASKLDPHPRAFANRITADEMYAVFSPLWLGRDLAARAASDDVQER